MRYLKGFGKCSMVRGCTMYVGVHTWQTWYNCWVPGCLPAGVAACGGLRHPIPAWSVDHPVRHLPGCGGACRELRSRIITACQASGEAGKDSTPGEGCISLKRRRLPLAHAMAGSSQALPMLLVCIRHSTPSIGPH